VTGQVRQQCDVGWCDETGAHDEHRAYLGSWVVETIGSEFPSTVQVFVAARQPAHPRAALVIVDGHLRQVGVALSWPQTAAVAAALVDAQRRFG
jgi:hypothetical protein